MKSSAFFTSANLIQSIASESLEESSIHITKAPRRKMTLRGRRGNQHNIGGMFHLVKNNASFL